MRTQRIVTISVARQIPPPGTGKNDMNDSFFSNSSIITTRLRRCGKVMFSVVSVCSQEREGSHVAITDDASVPTIQGPHCPRYITWLYWNLPPPPPIMSDGQNWRPVQTWSLEDTPPQSWHLVATVAHTVGKRTVHTLLECFLVV